MNIKREEGNNKNINSFYSNSRNTRISKNKQVEIHSSFINKWKNGSKYNKNVYSRREDRMSWNRYKNVIILNQK